MSEPTVTQTPALAPAKPFSINLIGPAVPLMQEVCQHVRNGYVVNRDYPMDFYQNGNISLMLHLGNPDEVAIADAKTSTERSAALELDEYNRRVREEAKRLVEHQQREELEKKVAALKAAQAKEMAALEKANAAALAKIEAQ